MAVWPFWPNWPKWPYLLESGVEVEGVSVGFVQLYTRLLGQLEEVLVGDSAPCGLQVVVVFLSHSEEGVAWIGAA